MGSLPGPDHAPAVVAALAEGEGPLLLPGGKAHGVGEVLQRESAYVSLPPPKTPAAAAATL